MLLVAIQDRKAWTGWVRDSSTILPDISAWPSAPRTTLSALGKRQHFWANPSGGSHRRESSRAASRLLRRTGERPLRPKARISGCFVCSLGLGILYGWGWFGGATVVSRTLALGSAAYHSLWQRVLGLWLPLLIAVAMFLLGLKAHTESNGIPTGPQGGLVVAASAAAALVEVVSAGVALAAVAAATSAILAVEVPAAAAQAENGNGKDPLVMTSRNICPTTRSRRSRPFVAQLCSTARPSPATS